MLLLAAQLVDLSVLAGVGERLAGFALLATAAWSWWSARRPGLDRLHDGRSPALVGFVHGATGAASLVLVLPVLAAGDAARILLFLASFAVGGALAMGALMASVGRLGSKLNAQNVARCQGGLLVAGLCLGSWLLLCA